MANITNFHDRFDVRNNTRLSVDGPDTANHKRTGRPSQTGSRSRMEKWSGEDGTEYTGFVRRNTSTGNVIEVSPRTAGGQRIGGSLDDKPARQAALSAFVDYEKARMAQERKAEDAEVFNKAQKMAESKVGHAETAVRDSQRKATQRADYILASEQARSGAGQQRITGTSGVRVTQSPATGETVISANVPADTTDDPTAVSGVIVSYAGAGDAPDGWLKCDGAAISRTTYADLFSAIGTTWGAGNGTTTFNLPNLNGKFLVGKLADDEDFGNVADDGGDKTHDHPEHAAADVAAALALDDVEHEHSWGGAAAYTDTGPQQVPNTASGTTGPAKNPGTTDDWTPSIVGSATNLAHEDGDNLPPFATIQWIIKI